MISLTRKAGMSSAAWTQTSALVVFHLQIMEIIDALQVSAT